MAFFDSLVQGDLEVMLPYYTHVSAIKPVLMDQRVKAFFDSLVQEDLEVIIIYYSHGVAPSTYLR